MCTTSGARSASRPSISRSAAKAMLRIRVGSSGNGRRIGIADTLGTRPRVGKTRHKAWIAVGMRLADSSWGIERRYLPKPSISASKPLNGRDSRS